MSRSWRCVFFMVSDPPNFLCLNKRPLRTKGLYVYRQKREREARRKGDMGTSPLSFGTVHKVMNLLWSGWPAPEVGILEKLELMEGFRNLPLNHNRPSGGLTTGGETERRETLSSWGGLHDDKWLDVSVCSLVWDFFLDRCDYGSLVLESTSYTIFVGTPSFCTHPFPWKYG